MFKLKEFVIVIGCAMLAVTIPMVFVITLFVRERSIIGDHPRMTSGTWVWLFAAASGWTTILGFVIYNANRYAYLYHHFR